MKMNKQEFPKWREGVLFVQTADTNVKRNRGRRHGHREEGGSLTREQGASSLL